MKLDELTREVTGVPMKELSKKEMSEVQGGYSKRLQREVNKWGWAAYRWGAGIEAGLSAFSK